jgi:hypothetical protein
MKLQHLVLKAGKSKSVKGHPIAYEMVEGVWHVLTSTGQNVTERTSAIGFDIQPKDDD